MMQDVSQQALPVMHLYRLDDAGRVAGFTIEMLQKSQPYAHIKLSLFGQADVEVWAGDTNGEVN